MNTETLTQIVETIKTLNLNIDSITAKEIAIEITPKILQYFYFVKILNFLAGVISITALVIITILIIKVIKRKLDDV